MGFRFRKSIKLFPGIKLNFSKSGMSTSIGGQGATINLSKRGTRQTIGLPGTGLSFSTFAAKAQVANTSDPLPQRPKSARSGKSCGCLIVGAILLLVLARCIPAAPDRHDPSLPFASGAASAFKEGDTVYVTATTLNGRSAPSNSGKILASFPKGTPVKVSDRSGEWLRVVKDGVALWIIANHVTSNPPTQPQRLRASAINNQPSASKNDVRVRRVQSSNPSHHGFFFGKACKRGKPCGNACISQNRVCHK
jgi:Protein of unknown function (DUF4236)/Bacterial SH3 domain